MVTYLKKLVTQRLRHPVQPMLMYIPFGAILLYASLHHQPRAWSTVLALLIIGCLSWSIVEYVLHRFLFHISDVKEPWKTLASGLHLDHHHNPEDPDKVLAPPLASLAFGAVVYLLFVLVSFSFSTGAILMVGLFAGYMIYEWVHYGAHHFKPKTKIGQYLRKYHLRHHYRYDDKAYGVTSPLWDMVFGTAEPKRAPTVTVGNTNL